MNEASYAELLEWDPFRDWQSLSMMEARAERELFNGLAVAFAKGVSDANSISFFRRARAVAERALAEDKLNSPPLDSRFPMNRAMLLRALTYARSLLGEQVDTGAMVQSASDFLHWCEGSGKKKWDSQDQAHFLAAVRLLVLVGDFDRLQGVLKSRKSLKWHATEHTLWTLLSKRRGAVSDNLEFRSALDRFFEEVRLPRVFDVFVELDILRLEVAAIRDKYLVALGDEVDWPRTVASIGK
jgi:hypothetical protein